MKTGVRSKMTENLDDKIFHNNISLIGVKIMMIYNFKQPIQVSNGTYKTATLKFVFS